MESLNELIEIAKSASKKAYAPYSKFPVGCVVVTNTGSRYSGCNIENISFGLTICAERAAVFKAISEEGPEMKIVQVVLFTPTDVPITPCGACRQVLKEFGDDFEISCICETDQVITHSINELLPRSPEIKF